MVTYPLAPSVSAFIVVVFIVVSGYMDIASASLFRRDNNKKSNKRLKTQR